MFLLQSIWFENEVSILPPAKFTKDKPTIDFGEFNGYVRDENGEKYIFNHVPAMGEDKSVIF